MYKKFRKLISIVMAVLLLSSQMAFAEEGSYKNSKEEVIYANLNTDGSLAESYVVNIIMPENGVVSDYGDYSAIRSMNTTDKLDYSGDSISANTSAEKIYYEGTLKDSHLPWNISIKYYLNDKEYTAEEIAGKSGKARIAISIRKNPNQSGSYFDDFALQMSLTLDTAKHKNITANGATIANVGANKQLTYTILSGTEKEIEITSDVTDFELTGISINGIHLALDIDVDDDELLDQINELLDAISELDEGAQELEDGAGEISDGTNTLSDNAPSLAEGVDSLLTGSRTLNSKMGDAVDGARELRNGAADVKDGAISLNDGASELNDGVLLIQSGLDTLNSKSSELTDGSAAVQSALGKIAQGVNGISVDTSQIDLLTSSSSSIQTAIGNISGGVSALNTAINSSAYKQAMAANGLDVDYIMVQNSSTADTINAASESLSSAAQTLYATGDAELISVADQISGAAGNLSILPALLSANNAAISGACTYLDTVNGSIVQLQSGISSLNSQYSTFHSGVTSLASSVKGMTGSLYTLQSGINELLNEYSSLDSGLREYTSAVAELVVGYVGIVNGSGALLSGSYALKSGSISLYAGTVELLDGMIQLYSATGTLTDGTGQLSNSTAELVVGVSSLRDGASTLYSGSTTLREGTNTLNEETENADAEIENKIDEMLGGLTGNSNGVQSYTSDKNGKIKSLQFVIKTPAIEIPEETLPEAEKVPEPGFWDKLKGLFS